jgi:signal peptidase I
MTQSDDMLHGSDSKSGTNKQRVIQIMKAGWAPSKKVCLSISGYSMYPLLRPGSKVTISTHVNPDRILIGDIVIIATQQHPGIMAHQGVMAHRIVFIQKRKGKPVSFLTKGDMNKAFDKAISQDQILGEIVAIQKKNRLINISKASWRIAGFLIAVSSGTFGLLYQLIDRHLLSSGPPQKKIGSWLYRFPFLAHRIFLYTIILSLQ